MSSLTIEGIEVLHYNNGADKDPLLSPRPYIHPLRTLSGVVLTDELAPDHPHHLGLSLTVSDLNEANFWGGRTFSGGKSLWLPNHGHQISTQITQEPTSILDSLQWLGPDRNELAVESRTIEAHPHPVSGCWAFSFSSTLRPGNGLTSAEISSSAVKGRKGAGYGGLFWRFPREARLIQALTSEHQDTDSIHGTKTSWLSISIEVNQKPATVILIQNRTSPLPWFVRTDEYIGACAALAWSQPLTFTATEPLEESLFAIVVDGIVNTATQAETLIAGHPLHTARSSSLN